MKKFAAVAIGMVGICSQAFGGQVVFAPTNLEVQVGTGAATVVDVQFLGGTGPGISLDAFDVIFGSDTVPIVDFSFSPQVLAEFPNRALSNPAGFGYYTNEVYASSNRATVLTLQEPLSVGTLTLDLSGLPEGPYTVTVDSGRDDALSSLTNRGNPDLLGGTLAIRVVPEPATMSLLALGALAAAVRTVRRRNA